MQKRCDRNRKRSKRRDLYCPTHLCYLNSVSPKYFLFADRLGQLQQRGFNRKNAHMLLQKKTAVSFKDEWLEAFWCDQCCGTKWYHVKKISKPDGQQACTYELSVASPELWQQAIGVIDPQGNPSVGEFTRRYARTAFYRDS